MQGVRLLLLLLVMVMLMMCTMGTACVSMLLLRMGCHIHCQRFPYPTLLLPLLLSRTAASMPPSLLILLLLAALLLLLQADVGGGCFAPWSM